MNRLIFDTELNGHHLEYLHHIYMGAMKDTQNKYIFAIPDNFYQFQNQLEWPDASNIIFHFISKSEIDKCHANMLKRLYLESSLAKKIINKYSADEIFLIHLRPFLPILPILVSKKVKISGIIYNLYLYRNYGKIKSFFEKFRYKSIVKKKGTVFILNDSLSVKKLNDQYKTQIFKSLPDPIPTIAFLPYSNLADNIEVTESRTFLQFGFMSSRKGTLDILKAILLLPSNFKASFIFAGIIDEEIKTEFYSLVDENKNKDIRIIVEDKYCDYKYINDLCHISDCILIPYYNTAQSSGVLGYAAAHHIPVIGPKEGLLGHLIKSNNLGKTIDHISPEEISKEIISFKKYSTDSSYVEKNSIANFVKAILD